MSKTRLRLGIDTNILIYAINTASEFHQPARQLLKDVAGGRYEGIVTGQNLIEFFAIVTDLRRFPKALSPDQAIEEIGNFMAIMQVVSPNAKTIVTWLELARKIQPLAQKIHDIVLAATFLTNGVDKIVSENVNDFAGIEGLEVVRMDTFLEAK